MTSRPHELGVNPTNRRRSFRAAPDDRRNKQSGGNRAQMKATPPPDTTSAENFYYLKQMSAKTPMVIVMNDGEEIRGCIEWYDRSCLKVNRDGAPNLLIQKQWIKYLFKQAEA